MFAPNSRLRYEHTRAPNTHITRVCVAIVAAPAVRVIFEHINMNTLRCAYVCVCVCVCARAPVCELKVMRPY